MTLRAFVCLCCCLLAVACGARSESSNQNVAPPVATSTPQQAGTSQASSQPTDSPGGVETAPGARQSATPTTTTARKLDPCALLTAADIKEVRGETVSKQTPSERVSGAFVVAQCYYAVESPSNSVNLALKREDPNHAGQSAIKNLWQRFHDAKANKKSEAPEPVSGVGDGAYWEGGSRFGILHVLRGDAYILSISIGGADAPEEKRKKSIALATKALKRLPS